jgi:hypothetical protein
VTFRTKEVLRQTGHEAGSLAGIVPDIIPVKAFRGTLRVAGIFRTTFLQLQVVGSEKDGEEKCDQAPPGNQVVEPTEALWPAAAEKAEPALDS